MQQVDLTKFPNGSGWHIVHDPENMCYRIKSEKGQSKPGVFTQRRFAEKALYDYLEEVSKPPKKVGRPKKTEE
tara:strand:+ start:1830 stop:2048 length:219 start_codon:yes stop_codon:yes gene_type:complete